MSAVAVRVLSMETSFHIYSRPPTDINPMAIFYVLNLQIKFRYLLF